MSSHEAVHVRKVARFRDECVDNIIHTNAASVYEFSSSLSVLRQQPCIRVCCARLSGRTCVDTAARRKFLARSRQLTHETGVHAEAPGCRPGSEAQGRPASASAR